MLKLLGPLRWIVYFGLFMCQWLHAKMAAALDVEKPSVMQGGSDTSQLDSATTSIIELGLYVAYSVATVGIVIGLVLCVPVIGKQDQGLKTVKGSVIVVIVAGVIHALFGFLGSLFS